MAKSSSSAMWLFVLAGVVLAGVIVLAMFNKKLPAEHDSFAQCLSDEGTTFFGTYWCPNCANQKAMFGNSIQYVDYKECSTPNGRDFALCADDNIEAVPTWEFADGTRLRGLQNLETLAEKTGCSLTGETEEVKEGDSSLSDGNENVLIDLGVVEFNGENKDGVPVMAPVEDGALQLKPVGDSSDSATEEGEAATN